MPNPVQTNPLGVNAPQGNEVYSSQLILPVAADPAGNAQTITGMTTANPTVITTTAAHGFISGQLVLVNTGTAFVATGTLPTSKPYVATVLSATTFSIPFNYTGAYTSGGAVFQNFQPGQTVSWQSWSGTASGDSVASAFPTVALTPITTATNNQVGVIIGYNTFSSYAPPPVLNGQYVIQVCTQGLCQVYVDATTAVGNNLSGSVARPGCAKVLTATTGLNLGVSLQAVTNVSVYLPLLSWMFVKLS